MRAQSISRSGNPPIAITVAIAHIAVLVMLTRQPTHLPSDLKPESQVPVVTTGFVIEETRAHEVIPVPEVSLAEPKISPNVLQAVQWISDDWGDISGVTAAASAPELSRFQPVDPAVFARRARLQAGESVSVVVTVEVLADGRSGAVELTRESANPVANQAALAYARELRWTPGTRDHHAETMRVSIPVTLVWNA
jgi:TonB family protein